MRITVVANDDVLAVPGTVSLHAATPTNALEIARSRIRTVPGISSAASGE
jgi:hypothetical protein